MTRKDTSATPSAIVTQKSTKPSRHASTPIIARAADESIGPGECSRKAMSPNRNMTPRSSNTTCPQGTHLRRADAVTDELLERYELLKAKVEKSTRTTPSDPICRPRDRNGKPGKKTRNDVRGKAKPKHRQQSMPTTGHRRQANPIATSCRQQLMRPGCKAWRSLAPALLIQPASGANGSVGRRLILACPPPASRRSPARPRRHRCVVASTIIVVSVT